MFDENLLEPKNNDEATEEKPEVCHMEVPLSFQLSNPSHQLETQYQGKVLLYDEKILLQPKLGEIKIIPFRDITDFSEINYHIYLTLTTQEIVDIYNLGFQYDNFLFKFSKLRNEVLLTDLLFREKLRFSNIKADYSFQLTENSPEVSGICEPRLYETALVILPQKGELIRIPYSLIHEIIHEDYRLTFIMEDGIRISLAKMGSMTDPFKKALSDTLQELMINCIKFLQELVPELDTQEASQLAHILKDGRTVSVNKLQQMNDSFWRIIEEKVKNLGFGEAYNFLKNIAQKSQIYCGIKQGLWGDLTGDYIWFFFPIFAINQKPLLNPIIAMEAFSTREAQSRATYLFKIPQEYNSQNLNSFIQLMDRCLLTLNFRREPIYLPEAKLHEKRYQSYKTAVAKIAELRTLRQMFLGRIPHKDIEKWKQDVLRMIEEA